MSYDDPDDDEDWYDDNQVDDEEDVSCPECGGEIYSDADRCPACGYWLTEADHRTLSPGLSHSAWVKATAIVVLVALLVALLGTVAVIR